MSRSANSTDFFPGVAVSDFTIVQGELPFSFAQPKWGQTTTCTLQRVGDVVVDLCLEIEVAKADTSQQALPTGSFYPAEAMFDSIAISIGGVQPESLTKDWLRVYDATLRPTDKANQYLASTNFDATTITSTATSTERLYLTVPFWFTRNTNQALPICNLNEVPRISITTTQDPGSLGLDPSQPPQLRMFASYAIMTPEASAQLKKSLHYDADIVQTKVMTLRTPSTTNEAPFSVDLTLTGWVRALFWVFKSTADNVGHARYIGAAGVVEQALQPDPSAMTGLGPVQTLSEVLAPLASAALLIDGQDNFGARPGKYLNVGGASRFLERLPPPGIYAISLAETPLYGGGGMNASQAQLRLAGKVQKVRPRARAGQPQGRGADRAQLRASRVRHHQDGIHHRQQWPLLTRHVMRRWSSGSRGTSARTNLLCISCSSSCCREGTSDVDDVGGWRRGHQRAVTVTHLAEEAPLALLGSVLGVAQRGVLRPPRL